MIEKVSNRFTVHDEENKNCICHECIRRRVRKEFNHYYKVKHICNSKNKLSSNDEAKKKCKRIKEYREYLDKLNKVKGEITVKKKVKIEKVKSPLRKFERCPFHKLHVEHDNRDSELGLLLFNSGYRKKAIRGEKIKDVTICIMI